MISTFIYCLDIRDILPRDTLIFLLHNSSITGIAFGISGANVNIHTLSRSPYISITDLNP